MFARAVLSILIFLSASEALAQSPSPIGTFKAWTAFTAKEKQGRACYMASQPKSTKPKGVKRDEIWILVTHRPYKKVRNEVSVYVGYPFKPDSKAVVTIDGKKYKLFTDDETAWADLPNRAYLFHDTRKHERDPIIRLLRPFRDTP